MKRVGDEAAFRFLSAQGKVLPQRHALSCLASKSGVLYYSPDFRFSFPSFERCKRWHSEAAALYGYGEAADIRTSALAHCIPKGK